MIQRRSRIRWAEHTEVTQTPSTTPTTAALTTHPRWSSCRTRWSASAQSRLRRSSTSSAVYAPRRCLFKRIRLREGAGHDLRRALQAGRGLAPGAGRPRGADAPPPLDVGVEGRQAQGRGLRRAGRCWACCPKPSARSEAARTGTSRSTIRCSMPTRSACSRLTRANWRGCGAGCFFLKTKSNEYGMAHSATHIDPSLPLSIERVAGVTGNPMTDWMSQCCDVRPYFAFFNDAGRVAVYTTRHPSTAGRRPSPSTCQPRRELTARPTPRWR